MGIYALCVDIGTSSLKGGIIDIDPLPKKKRLIDFVKVSYNDSRRESISAMVWEDAFFEVCAMLMGEVNISVVCVSSNGPTLICCDSEGNVLKTLHWFEDVNRIANIKSFFLPHVLNFKMQHKDLYERTKYFISPQEWLLHRLGASIKTCLPTPLYKPFYWDEQQLNELHLDADKFPPFVGLGSIIGSVSEKAAAKCKLLKSGTPLVCGGPDFIMALLGCGITKSGLACDRAGSSEGINYCVESLSSLQQGFNTANNVRVLPSPIRVLPSPIDGLHNLSVVINESGSLFDTWRLANCDANETYAQTLQRMMQGKKRRYKREMLPDILQHITDGVCDALSVLKANGANIDQLVVCGGQSKLLLWNQIKADITGCTFLLPEISDSELTGDAACASSALKLVCNISEAIEYLLVIKQTVRPSGKTG
ncbi:MAG: FGGY-family carbohydrate kinase [Termitinemataceae bacterium]|nr:MAG: FGGY-family carbohydrate kinase [Termitinemataceae bacterium]